MMKSIIDSHIHFDLYKKSEQQTIIQDMESSKIESLICVSNYLKSAEKTLQLAKNNSRLKPAFGYHPEQALPQMNEMENLLRFIKKNNKQMVAIGEVGLPYYLRQNNTNISMDPYVELLEVFIKQAVYYDKPLILHAVYDDAPFVCDLLEQHAIQKVHFHWFKGDQQTIQRMILNGYFISVTPDIMYEKGIQALVNQYPLSQLMVETDGPWPFEYLFKNQMTHPKMIHQSIRKIAEIKNLDVSTVYETIYNNTKKFYNI